MSHATRPHTARLRPESLAKFTLEHRRRAGASYGRIETLECRALLTTYYVSTSGLAGNSGTSIDQPLATIQQAVDVAMAGDTVLVRGGTYRETITTPRSGTTSGRLTIQNYNNETVTVNGTDVINGSWTSVGNEVYRAPMSWNYQFENQSTAYNSNQVFVGGQEIELARWPNQTSTDVVLKSNAFADSVTIANGQVTFNDADFTDNPARWVGAKIWVNLARGDHDGQGQTGTVVSATNGSITVSGIDSRGGSQPWGVGAGTEYYLFQPTVTALNDTGGIAAGLDRGEWFLDTANQQLYVRTPTGTAPAANAVEAKRRTYGFNLDGDSYITIKGINLFGTSLTTDNLAKDRNVNPGGVAAASNILIDGMTARYVTHFTDQTGNYQMQWQQKSGLILSGTNITFQNGDVRLSAGSGISMIGRQGKILNSVFRDLNLAGADAGMVNFGKAWDPGHGFAVSEDHEFAYNTLSRSPQQGISFNALTNSTNDPNDVRARIHHNVIHDVMLRSADSAAINSANTNHKYVRIDHNVIYNLTGNARKYGIYFDFASHAIIDHNVIYNVTRPININWTSSTDNQNMRIYNNVGISDLATRAGLSTREHNVSPGSIIRNNIFGYQVITPTGATVSNNLVASDALFVDSTNSDMSLRNYQLKSSATTAIDQGISVSPYDDTLADGPDSDTIAQPDIGAYEYNTAAWTAGVPVATGTLVNVATGGTASASSENTDRGEVASKAFDGLNTTKWLARTSTATLTYAFATGVSRTVTQYKLTSANDTATYPGRAPKDWTLQGYNGSTWVTLDTRTNEAETANFTTRTYTVTTPGSYSEYRLNISANNGATMIQLAELQLMGPSGTQTSSKLTGTAIGTAGSYNNNGNTIAKVFDNNLGTHFDAPGPNGAWAGLDLGSAKTITQIKYAPRSTLPGRMVGGQFQVSNTADFASATTIYTISSSPATGTLTTQSVSVSGTWRYVRYLSPDGSYGNIAEMEVFGF